MTATEVVARYVSARDSFVERIAVISSELTIWTEKHSKVSPFLSDVAHFEGLRAERSRLLAEFQEFEDQFVLDLLNGLSSKHEKD